jgi:CheY-like chemotaxis protein
MPVKLLLADKSITIQKVVEMLFSGREYEVICVSDGENALSEASRVVPDVVLADIDLPRIDGYNFATKIKQIPALAQIPVILMMSRDDVYNDAKGRESGIIDHIAKPFESQELIGKVKKALAAVRISEPAPAARATASTPPKPPLVSTPPATPVVPPAALKDASKPKQPLPPTDIFDIIQEAPTQAELKRTAAPTHAEEDESVFEVEPVVEVEEPLGSDLEQSLPLGEKAVEEMRAGLGLTDKKKEAEPEIVTFESLDMATQTFGDFSPSPKKPMQPSAEPPQSITRPADVQRREPEVVAPSMQATQISEEMVRKMVEETVAKMAKDVFAKSPPVQVPTLPESELRSMAEAAIAELAKEVIEMLPPPRPPKVSEETVRRGIEDAVSKIAREMAREVIEKVAWEVIPELAEQLIKQEIERLKAET